MELLLVFCFALIIGFIGGVYFSHRESDHRINDIKNYSQESLKNMQDRFNMLSTQILDIQKEKFEQESSHHLHQILRPIHDNLVQLDRTLKETNEKSTAQSFSFQEAIKKLSEQTASIGKEANQLAHALKNNSKVQGDWGEMILSNILEKSGLREGEEYEVQKNFKSADGANVRPDVVIHFPERKHIVIDSKVSLKDFTDYMNAEDTASQEQALKRHLLSVRNHIDELSRQNYPKDVKGSPEYVIMFMPSEASYVYAIQADENINSYAWSRKVIIACPNILIMTLQIVNNIWQSARQARNVEKIIASANDLYYHFALFTEVFSKIGRGLDTLQNDYVVAKKRLSEGRGNLVQRFENMRSLGLSPKKEIDDKLKGE